MSPVNPGERWPLPTRTQQVVTVVRSNSVMVAFVVGELAGVVIALLITGSR